MSEKPYRHLYSLRKRVMAAIPDNWCDSLLTGPRGIKVPAGCRDIENLLIGVRAAVDAVFIEERRQNTWPEYLPVPQEQKP